MSAFVLRRLLLAVPTLFGVLIVAFLLLYVAPGDPVQAMVGERADSATIARMARCGMLDSLSADYVRTARAKGLRESIVVGRHALRNALIPIITVLGLDFGSYLTGSILTETIFSWPGIGRYVVNAIARRDLPAIQGSVLFLSAVVVLVYHLTDVAYANADPRVRYG